MDFVSQLAETDAACEAPLTFSSVIILVAVSCALGLVWAAFNFMSVKKINVETGEDGESDSLIGDIP